MSNPDPESVPVPLRQKVPVSAGPVPQHCHFHLLWALFLIVIRMNPCNDLTLLVRDPVAMNLKNTVRFFFTDPDIDIHKSLRGLDLNISF